MSSEIINLCNSDNKRIWHQALSFCEEWQSNKTQFELSTSGSTGNPKVIQIARSQMEVSAYQTIQALQLQQNDRLLVCINTNFIGGKMMLVRGLVGGMQLMITEPSSNPLENINEHIDFMAVVPIQLQTMIQKGEVEKLNAMKCIIVGGAQVSITLQQLIEQLKVPVYATYGMTETVSHIALKKLNSSNKRDYFDVIGDTRISTDHRECLIIKGKITNNKSIVTNDIVKLIDAHKFEWLGRYDNVINSGGIKIHPEQIEKQVEAVFEQLNISRRFFINGLKDEQLGQKTVLFIEGDNFDVSELTSNLKNELQKYHYPKTILFSDKFSETASGKIQRESTIKNLLK